MDFTDLSSKFGFLIALCSMVSAIVVGVWKISRTATRMELVVEKLVYRVDEHDTDLKRTRALTHANTNTLNVQAERITSIQKDVIRLEKGTSNV